MFSKIALIIIIIFPLCSTAYAAGDYYPPANSAASTSRAATIDKLYNPEQNNKNPQAVLDTLKQRYENILITYFFLRRCKEANPGDYHIIISSLAAEMASVNAPGRLEYDVVAAAEGSYKEVYSRSDCKSAPALAAQYNDFIKKLAARIPPEP